MAFVAIRRFESRGYVRIMDGRTRLTLKKKGSTLPVKFTTSMEGSIETEHLHIRSLNYSVDMQ